MVLKSKVFFIIYYGLFWNIRFTFQFAYIYFIFIFFRLPLKPTPKRNLFPCIFVLLNFYSLFTKDYNWVSLIRAAGFSLSVSDLFQNDPYKFHPFHHIVCWDQVILLTYKKLFQLHPASKLSCSPRELQAPTKRKWRLLPQNNSSVTRKDKPFRRPSSGTQFFRVTDQGEWEALYNWASLCDNFPQSTNSPKE